MNNEAIHTDLAPQAIGPYSQAVKRSAGEMVFFSGQVALDPETQALTGANAAEQTRQALMNLKAVIESSGATMADVVKTTVYLQSMSDFQAVNEVYGEFFSSPYPARAAVEVARLPKDALVEVDAIAIKD